MNRYALALLVLLLVSLSIFAQTPDAAKSNGGGAAAASSIPPAPAITDTSTPAELARAALAAQGGDKFKNLKSSVRCGGNAKIVITLSISLGPFH